MTPPIRLVLSDVDGTLITSEKVLTSATIEAVKRLHDAGIMFAISSGRPPRGLTMFVEPLGLTTPLCAFNGGMITTTELEPLRELTLDDDLIAPTIDVLDRHRQSVWVYQGLDWYTVDLEGPHVAREVRACQFTPIEVRNFHHLTDHVVKVVGVNDTPELVHAAQLELVEAFGERVSATRSQTYYLDVTHSEANKGRAVEFLASRYDLDCDEIAVVGDAENDLAMFERAGLSVAMGNARDEVKAHADYVTATNDDDGLAQAIDRFILGASSAR